jgi:site-specific DNA-cytosine methylase
MPTLCARDYKDPKLVLVAQLDGYESSGRVYSDDGLAPTINTMGGGQREPKISVKTWNGETKALKTKANDMPRDRIYIDESIGFAITTNESQMPHIAIKEDTFVGKKYKEFYEEKGYIPDTFNPYNKTELGDVAPTITTQSGSTASSASILIKEATTKGYAEASDGDGVYINRPEQKRGVVQKGMIQTIKTSGSDVGVVVKEKSNLKSQMCEQLIREGKAKENDVIRHSYTKSRMRGDMKDIQENNISPTLDTRADCLGVVVQQKARGYNKGGKHELCPPITSNSFQENNHLLSGLRIRKLTPFECWRLMGISDEDFYKAKNAGVSNSQLYKQAGNGIVVNVFEAILREMIR